MKKSFNLVIAMLIVTCNIFAHTIIVDKNGGGQFTSIQTAIINSTTNDTVKVWPGDYVEQITLNKEIVLMGSGYENTIIRGNFQSTITMSAGKLMWFLITSTMNTGISMSGGIVTNCIVSSCPSYGISSTSGTSSVINCILYNNGTSGVHPLSGVINVTNCIGVGSTDYNFNGWGATLNLSYSNGSSAYTNGNQGCTNSDPLFVSSTDYHISQGSPCWNSGNPSLSDPDGSRSDMGYFGGPDCPIYPTVFEIIITPDGNNINLQAKGRANY
jgi:hypothetical protein